MTKPSPQDRRAEDLLRSFRSIARIPGTLVVEAGRLRLIAGPHKRPEQPLELARLLFRQELGSFADLPKLLAGVEIIDIDRGRLARWAHHLRLVESSHDVDTLIRDGVRALRRYRGRDLKAEWRRHRQQLARYGAALTSIKAARSLLTPDNSARSSTQTLINALPCRLFALADWPIDPVARLRLPGAAAEALLIKLAASSEVPRLRCLAVVLLAQIAKLAGAEPQPPQQLPGDLHASYSTAFHGPAYSPCLLAEALENGAGLPPLEHLPRQGQRQVVRTAERVAIVRGFDAALDTLEHLAVPFSAPAERSANNHRKLERFLRACQGHSLPQIRPEEHLAVKRLSRLPDDPRLRARGVVQEFLSWVRPDAERRLPRRQLLRTALTSSSNSLADLGLALYRAWKPLLIIREDDVDVEPGTQRSRLALSLLEPSLGLRLRESPPSAQRKALIKTISSLDAKQSAILGPYLVELADQRRLTGKAALLASGPSPPELTRRAIELEVTDGALALAKSPRKLSSYLDCVEHLQGIDPLPDWLDEDWFLRLFDAGKAWSSALVLALVSHSRSKEDPMSSGALFAISQALAKKDTELAKALDRWATVRVETPPSNLPRLAAILQMKVEDLEAYLHHRRLAGQEEVFANNLLAPLREAENRDKQIRYLESLTPEDEEQRRSITETLRQLYDEERFAGALEARVRRARNNYFRSLKRLRAASLDRVLDDACRTAAHKVLGRRLPHELPAGFRQAFHLLHSDHTEMHLLQDFLGDVLEDRDAWERPQNRAWLENAQRAGVDTEAWLAGLHFTAKVGNRTITFETEQNPLHSLRMGSYFNTCLTLEGGFNAASTLTNTLDINKQVIFGRDPNSNIVARKLIGATAQGELAGYYTYATSHSREIRRILDREARRFADRCGLCLSDSATPEVLHRGFWYDDGNASWTPARTPDIFPQTPEGAPDDHEAVLEHALRHALITDDEELLAELAERASGAVQETAYLRSLERSPHSKARPSAHSLYLWRFERVAAVLTTRGELTWLDAAKDHFQEDVDRAQILLGALPKDTRGTPEIVALVRACFADGSTDEDEIYLPSPRWAQAATPCLVELIGTCLQHNQAVDDSGHRWVEELSGLVLLAYLQRSSNERNTLCRLLSRDADLLVLGGLAGRRVAMPQLATAWRRALPRASRGEAETLALALGRVGDPADGERLLLLLDRWPDSLPLAVGAQRCGVGEQAREHWIPPVDLLDACENPQWKSLLRELAPPQVGRRLRRQLSRASQTADMDLARRLVALLGELGLRDYPPSRLADELGFALRTNRQRTLVTADKHWLTVAAWFDRLPSGVERPADDGEITWLLANDREVLDTLLPVLAEGSHGKSQRALEQLLPNPALRRLVLALARPLAAELPTPLVRRAAELVGGARHRELGVDHAVDACDWLATLPEGVRAEVFAERLEKEAWLEDTSLLLLSRMLETDPALCASLHESCLLLTICETSRLLDLTFFMLCWLSPDIAEPIVVRLLRGIDTSSVIDADLQNFWPDGTRSSYRFQDLLAEHLVPRLEPDLRRSLVELAEKTQTDRGKWLAERLKRFSDPQEESAPS